MPRPKGLPKTGGRKTGTLNKNTTVLKDAILLAADEAGDDLASKGGPGGKVGYLKWLATNNSSAFSSLLGKVLPTTIAGDEENPLAIKEVNPEARLEAFMAFLEKTKKG